MYSITGLLNGKWAVSCMIQDGTECWQEDSREAAVHSLISAARAYNHSYIREDDISFEYESPPARTPVCENDERLLDEIKRGVKKVLDCDNYLLKYRITRDEAEILIGIREGRFRVIST